jgi:uncharacterized protein
LAGIGSIPQSYLLLTEVDRRAVRQEVEAQLSQFKVNGNLHMTVEMLIGSGQKDQEGMSAALPASNRPAPFDPRFADLLVCPSTAGPLEYAPATGELISRRAGLAFPIRDGIPIMLPNTARRLSP